MGDEWEIYDGVGTSRTASIGLEYARFAGAVSTTCIQDYDWSTAVLRMNTGPLMLPMGIRMEMPWCCHSGAMIRTQKA